MTTIQDEPVCYHGKPKTEVCDQCLADITESRPHDHMGRPHTPTSSWPCWCVPEDPAWPVPKQGK